MFPPLAEITADGYDLQFGTNVIGEYFSAVKIAILHIAYDCLPVGHFYLTKLLMPALIAGKDTSPDHYARVITTSSAASYLATLHWETFKDGPARRRQTTGALYNQSKLVSVGFQFMCSKFHETTTRRRM